jgi:hypothetical protein
MDGSTLARQSGVMLCTFNSLNNMKKPITQDQAITDARKLLSDNFDCGIVIVAWEEQGTTFHMETKFGNEYATQNLADRASEFFEEEETELELEEDEE